MNEWFRPPFLFLFPFASLFRLCFFWFRFQFRFWFQISDPDFWIRISDPDFVSGFLIRISFPISVPDFDSRFRFQISDPDFGSGFRIRIPDFGSEFQFRILVPDFSHFLSDLESDFKSKYVLPLQTILFHYVIRCRSSVRIYSDLFSKVLYIKPLKL